MSEPTAAEILQRSAARIRCDIGHALAWSWWLTAATIAVALTNLGMIAVATFKYDPPGILVIGLCGMTLIFIDGMHAKVKVQREHIEMLHTTLDQLEAQVNAQGEKP